MPNPRRVAAGAVARFLARLLDGLQPGDLTWLARTIFEDRDKSQAGALDAFTKAYHEIFYLNGSADMRANGEVALLQRLSRLPLRVAFDVGANVGEWTLAVKQALPELQVHAFEIIPSTARELAGRLAGLDGVRINDIGLSDAAGDVSVWFSAAHTELTSVVAERTVENPELAASWQNLTVPVITGDDYVSQNNVEKIDILKIDVEGSEMKVLKGFERSFARNIIDIVQFEYAPLNKYIPLLLKDFYEFFEPRGFVTGKIFPKGVAFKPYETEDENFIGLNYLACRAAQRDFVECLKYRREGMPHAVNNPG
jgi:FkbM family methyltransferase